MRLRYTEKAKEDIEIAFAWYEEQQQGLGFDFLDCTEETIKITDGQTGLQVGEGSHGSRDSRIYYGKDKKRG